jgi:GNAT superfamily N-acetyltransferase
MSDTTRSISVRPLQADDFEQWSVLWDGYLAFYREELSAELTRHSFERLSGAANDMHGLVAVVDGRLGGLAHLMFHPTTWSSEPDCYLEDLFVGREHRGGATAQALIDAVYAEAKRRKCDRVYWRTQQFNAPARSFYDRVGSLTSEVVYEHELD